MNKIGPVLVIAVGFILGVLIWRLSPHFTGVNEPWDSSGPYYLGTLFASGVIAGLFSPRHAMKAPFGIYAGQFTLGWGSIAGKSLWPIGLMFGVAYCLVAAAGSLIVFKVWEKTRKPAK